MAFLTVNRAECWRWRGGFLLDYVANFVSDWLVGF